MAYQNAANINPTGLVNADGAGGFSGVTTTQYNVQVGAASNGLSSVAPSATSGVPLISQGSSANPAFGTAVVAGGGTGSTSFNTYGPLVAGATSTAAITSVAPSATSGVPLISQGSSANPAFGTAVVAGGGTGVSSTTAYGVICGGTTTTAAFQNAGAGSSGQLLVSNGTSALPSWGTGSTSGASLQLVQSQTASNSANISFTNLTGGATYLLIMTGIQPVTNTASLRLTVSQNNGVSYLATGYTCGINYYAYNSTTLTNSNNTAFAPLSGPLSNIDIYAGSIYLHNMNVGNPLEPTGTASWFDTTLNTTAFGQVGGRTSTGINAIRFTMSSGNINGGVFTLYLVKTA